MDMASRKKIAYAIPVALLLILVVYVLVSRTPGWGAVSIRLKERFSARLLAMTGMTSMWGVPLSR